MGLTQAQVAGRAGVSRDWVISIEKGRRLTVDFERLMRTLDVLGLTIEISAAEGHQSDADRAVLDSISRAQFNDLSRLRNEITHSPSLAELRERVAELIDPKVIVSDATREALLVALQAAQPEIGDGKSDGDS